MNFTNFFILLISCLLSVSACGQNNISGNFPALAGQQVRLVGFQDLDVYTIDSTVVSEQGYFTLRYVEKDLGMGYLAAEDHKAYFVVLANENIQLKGDVLSMPQSIVTLSGKENKLFVQYAAEHAKREQTLSAWVYLRKIYESDSLFTHQVKSKQAIETEMLRIKQEDERFLKNLDPQSYISWFLPTRKLVSSVSTVAQYRTEEIPATLTAFRKLDYTDARLYKSGLLRDVIDSHFWLLENMGKALDSVYKEMAISIDYLIESLSNNEEKFSLLTKYLFNLLEKHSLFRASEYLSIKVLTQNSCMLNDDLAKQLESYRAMQKGNIASDIIFTGNVLKGGSIINTPEKLSDIQSAYKVVVFGASWCPQCVEELRELLALYEKWKAQSVEIVFVSLDTDENQFNSFSGIFPFISMCDYLKWEGKAVLDYYVFATPSMFLLDHNQKIILRPSSVKQIDAWVDWYLVQGKK